MGRPPLTAAGPVPAPPRRLRDRLPARVKDRLRPLKEGLLYSQIAALWYFWRAGAFRQGHPLFDAAYYLEQIPETPSGSPLVHYIFHGASQGLRPHPLFDPQYYVSQSLLAARAGGNPLLHFLKSDPALCLSPHPLFDCANYRLQYPEAAPAGINPLVHFLTLGAKASARPHPLFHTTYYVTKYPEVTRSGLNPLIHYLLRGAAAAYQPNPLFDPAFYAAQSPSGSLIHYVLQGGMNLLKPHRWFDPTYYLSQRLDARRTGRNPLEHFFEVGSREHSSPHPLFDYAAYLRAHPGTTGDALVAFVENGSRGGAPIEGGLFACDREP